MSSKPRVIIYATGGTIAGAASTSTDAAVYSSGVVSVDQLIAAVPEIKRIADIKGQQICNVGSPDIDSITLVRMAQKIQQDLADPMVAGVVITHGTDTIEETAFFLDLTLKSEKPVVCVGSMRPPNVHSADGPMNLLEAVRLASFAGSRNRGVLITLNDRICPARFVTKTNANRLETFRAGDAGYLGTFENSQPIFFYPPARAVGWRHFDISKVDPKKGLPKVNIHYGHLEADNDLLQASIKAGAKGIILAGMGAGCWTTAGGKELASLIKKHDKFPVVASYRSCEGFIDGKNEIYGLGKLAVGGGYLNPAKCRIQLQLCLATGLDTSKTKTVFEQK